MAATRPILLVRHGQSEWNAQRRWQGIADPPLSPDGRRTAAQLAASLTGLVPSIAGVIWSSPLARARETATIIARHADLEVRVEDRLAERSVGVWMGLTNEEIDARWPGDRVAARWPEGFEPTASVIARATAALADIAAATPDRAVVVAHAGILRSLLSRQPTQDGPIPNLGGSWFDVTPSRNGDEPVVVATERFPAVPAPSGTVDPQPL